MELPNSATIRRVLLKLASVCATCCFARADVNIPPGYYLVNLSNDPGSYNSWAGINNHGTIVWSHGSDPFDASTYEIMLYDKTTGKVIQISHNNVYDRFPAVNDAGTVVWSSAVGPGGVFEIAIWRDGKVNYLTNENAQPIASDNVTPRINDLGHVVWSRSVPPQCNPIESEIWHFDGSATQALTSIGAYNHSPINNNLDQIGWDHFDSCNQENPDGVMLYSDGRLLNIANVLPGCVTHGISDTGVMSLSVPTVNEFGFALYSWENGKLTPITDWGVAAYISRNGRWMSFIRWYEDDQTWQQFLWHNGHIKQVTSDPFWSFDGRVNNFGELAWTYGVYPHYQIRALLRRPAGDLNCDGAVTLSDITGFVLALTSQEAYSLAMPDCDRELADVNMDGAVTVADIANFVNELVSIQQPASER